MLLLLKNWSLRLLMMFDYEIKMYCTQESGVCLSSMPLLYIVEGNRRMKLFFLLGSRLCLVFLND